MSTWRILGLGALVAAVALVTVVAVGLWSPMGYGRECTSWFGEGLLGPEEQRQRVETPHGFAISMAGDWTAEVPPPDTDAEERLGMRALLTMHPPAENEQCTVFLAAGAASDEGPPDAHVLGARLLPWFAERGARIGVSGADIDGPCRDRMIGLYFGSDFGRAAGAWVVPREDDLYLLACVRTPVAGEQRPPELWSPADMVHTNMGAMALSLEFPPTADE